MTRKRTSKGYAKQVPPVRRPRKTSRGKRAGSKRSSSKKRYRSSGETETHRLGTSPQVRPGGPLGTPTNPRRRQHPSTPATDVRTSSSIEVSPDYIHGFYEEGMQLDEDTANLTNMLRSLEPESALTISNRGIKAAMRTDKKLGKSADMIQLMNDRRKAETQMQWIHDVSNRETLRPYSRIIEAHLARIRRIKNVASEMRTYNKLVGNLYNYIESLCSDSDNLFCNENSASI